jgi:hypothetical protein
MNPRYRRLLIPGLLVTLVVVALLGSLRERAQGAESGPVEVSRITDPRITESSGLALSRSTEDLAYTINDSGNEPVVYAIRVSTGEVEGTTRIRGGTLVDTEALALDGEGTLWIADVGDNDGVRDDIALYALPEPGTGDSTVTATRYPIGLDYGAVDVETLLINPQTGGKFLVSKEPFGGQLFALPDELEPDRENVADAMDDYGAPLLVTDGAFTPDGEHVVLRTYVALHVYRAAPWSLLRAQDLPAQKQGETLAVEASGRSLLVGSEGKDSALLRLGFAVDDEQEPAPTATPEPSTSPPAEPDDGQPGTNGFAGLPFVVAAGAVALLCAVAAWLARRPARR